MYWRVYYIVRLLLLGYPKVIVQEGDTADPLSKGHQLQLPVHSLYICTLTESSADFKGSMLPEIVLNMTTGIEIRP
jgi:hypothetical protein